MNCDNLKLVKVNTKNFDALVDLEVNEEQKNYVASNVYSLAEASTTTRMQGRGLPSRIQRLKKEVKKWEKTL